MSAVGSGNGTIDGAKIGATYYPSGTSVTLTAEPDDDSSFTGWTGCDNDKTNDYYNLTVDILDATDITETANDKYVDGTGSISVSSDQNGTDETGDSTISSGSDTSFTCQKSDVSTIVTCYYKFLLVLLLRSIKLHPAQLLL